MRTYEETYERILSKKVVAEKEIKTRNKRIITSVTAVSCLGICLVALFAMSKARTVANLNKNDVNDVHMNSSSLNSTTLAEIPSNQTTAEPDADAVKPSVEEKDDTTTQNSPTKQSDSTTSFDTQVITTDVHGGNYTRSHSFFC